MSTRKSLAYGAALLSTNIKAAMAHRGAFWLQAAFMLVNNLIFVSFWWIFFTRFTSIGGWTCADTCVLYGIVAMTFGMSVVFSGGTRLLSRAISEGTLDTYLTQPKAPLLQVVLSHSYASGWGDMVSGIAMLALSGKVAWSAAPAVVAVSVCGATVFTASSIIVHSVAFWTGPLESLARQFSEFLITFGVYPPSLFGGWMRLLLFTAIPSAFIGYLPARIVTQFSWTELGVLAGGAIVYAALAIGVFSLGLRRYESGNQITLGSGA